MADHFLVIHLPGNLEPLERGEQYEDPLDEALHKAGKLGECVGGGTAMVTKPRSRITGCDIEVEVRSLDKALPVIQRVLEDSGARVGATVKEPETETTLLRFTRSGVKATKGKARLGSRTFRPKNASCSRHSTTDNARRSGKRRVG